MNPRAKHVVSLDGNIRNFTLEMLIIIFKNNFSNQEIIFIQNIFSPFHSSAVPFPSISCFCVHKNTTRWHVKPPKDIPRIFWVEILLYTYRKPPLNQARGPHSGPLA